MGRTEEPEEHEADAIVVGAREQISRRRIVLGQRWGDGRLEDQGEMGTVSLQNGRVVIRPKSLARASGAALSWLADRMFYLVCQELLPHMRPGELRREVEKMVAGVKR